LNLLLDTCTALWIASDAPELSGTARKLFAEPGNQIFLSVVSGWEIALKYSVGKLPLREPPSAFLPRLRELHAIASLPLDEASVLQLERLPAYHTDPFDRMLICQAINHGLTLLTPDAAITRYPVRSVW
jgi:PIN domain nuclease of toxin-antitoxin system